MTHILAYLKSSPIMLEKIEQTINSIFSIQLFVKHFIVKVKIGTIDASHLPGTDATVHGPLSTIHHFSMRFRTSSSHLLTLLPVFLLLQISSLSHVVLPIVRFEQYFLLLSLVSSGILRLHSTIFHSSASFLKESRLFSPQTQLSVPQLSAACIV